MASCYFLSPKWWWQRWDDGQSRIPGEGLDLQQVLDWKHIHRADMGSSLWPQFPGLWNGLPATQHSEEGPGRQPCLCHPGQAGQVNSVWAMEILHFSCCLGPWGQGRGGRQTGLIQACWSLKEDRLEQTKMPRLGKASTGSLPGETAWRFNCMQLHQVPWTRQFSKLLGIHHWERQSSFTRPFPKDEKTQA